MQSHTINDDCFCLEYYKEDYFDYALTIGMSAEEYWFGDPHLIYRYEAKHINQQKLKEQDMWLMGQYVVRALESSRLNVNGFIEKSSQLVPYPTCPHTDMFDNEQPLTEEQLELLASARAQLSARGLLRDT